MRRMFERASEFLLPAAGIADEARASFIPSALREYAGFATSTLRKSRLLNKCRLRSNSKLRTHPGISVLFITRRLSDKLSQLSPTCETPPPTI
jgi:hypothetical protein